MQNFLEIIVDFIVNTIGMTMDMKRGGKYIMPGLTLLLYIAVANILGLPLNFITEHHGDAPTFFGKEIAADALHEAHENHEHAAISWIKSPTADLSATMGLALMVVILSHYIGMKTSVKGYFKHYLQPHPLFLPLEIVNEISKLLTLGMRLFGNIFAGEVLIAVILLMPMAFNFLPIGALPMAIWQGFSVFVGLIQAFVFTVLTMVYISQKEAVADDY